MGDAELRGSLSGGQRPLAKGFENMVNEWAGVPVMQLLIFFKKPTLRGDAGAPASLLVRLRFAPASLKDWPEGRWHWFFYV